MNKEEFDFILFDRVEKIKAIDEVYNLKDNAYISFSGGKDSTILHYLIDIALPNNKIPRLFINTGIEYQDIRKYVKEMSLSDNRIIVLNSGVNIKEMLNKYGYPFKSKQHSHNLAIYQHSGNTITIKKYLKKIEGNKTITCPKILEYNFTPEFKIKCSENCCIQMKKKPAKKWSFENNKSIVLTGMRSKEGGQRLGANCIVTDKDNKLVKFHPLLVVSEEWEEEFLKRNNIKLCKLYYPPYNFKRTGCKGCPFALKLQDELDIMEKLLPNEAKQCEILWKPVYEEYRNIGYRLRKNGVCKQLSIFDMEV